MSGAAAPAGPSGDDRLAELAERLDTLDRQDVSEHPAVLDEVHRAVVAELEAIGGAGADPRPGQQPGPQTS